MLAPKRDAILTAFRGVETAIAASLRCLSEGIDVPEADLVAFMAPRRSPGEIAQMCGRVLRLSHHTQKTRGYVFVPVYLDEADPERTIVGENFSDALDIIHAMAAHDEALSDVMKVANGQGDHVPVNADALMAKITLYAPPEIVERLRAATEVRVFLPADAGIRDRRWNECFELLQQFHHQHGHIRVPVKLKVNGIALRGWLEGQRHLALRGDLHPDRLALLKTLGFTTPRPYAKSQPDSLDGRWNAYYRLLEQFHRAHGTSRCAERTRYRRWAGAQVAGPAALSRQQRKVA